MDLCQDITGGSLSTLHRQGVSEHIYYAVINKQTGVSVAVQNRGISGRPKQEYQWPSKTGVSVFWTATDTPVLDGH